jgi:MFS family permease
MATSGALSVRTLTVICLASAAWAFTFGTGTQSTTFWLADAGLDEVAIGLNAATYYFGMALAGLVVPWLMRCQCSGCVVAGMTLFGGTVALFPLATSLPGWFTLRLLQGVGGALSLIPMEALISKISAPQQRSRNFGLYGVALTLAGAAGLVVGLHVYQPGNGLPFLLAGTTALSGAALVWLCLPAAGENTEPLLTSTRLGWKENYLALGTAWVQGFLEGGLLTFLPLYLVSRGLEQETAGNLMGVAVTGVILFQVPVGWLADRLGKTPVLLLCYAAVGIGLAAVPLCGSGPALALWLFVIGGCSGSLFPIGLALLGDRLSGRALDRAYAGYMTLDCFGSVAGPACMGQAQKWSAGTGLFLAGQAVVALLLLSWSGLRLLGYNAGVRDQESGVRSQGSGVTGQESGSGNRNAA